MTDLPLENQLAELLKKHSLTLAVAESCTGGLVSDRITNIPGSSAFFLGGVTAYAYSAKIHLLGVRQETLELHGAVSQETVLEMARGVRQALAADIGLSVSGVAGPDGGTIEKPVGLTWIALSTNQFEQAWSYTWQGDRLQNKFRSAQQALQLLVDYLRVQDQTRRMELVEVTAQFDSHGDIQPQDFTWNSQRIHIGDIGRSWTDPLGKHILVMDHAGQTYELIFDFKETKWFIRINKETRQI
jgi:nicotinamide-nucleotide amidase